MLATERPHVPGHRTLENLTMANEQSESTLSVQQDPRWLQIVARDRSADGSFWYSVVTTGIYCRPSCPSRTASPGNVRIHDTQAQVQATGARPCKRCQPEGLSREAGNTALVAKACRLIEQGLAGPHARAPTLDALAEAAQISPGHFHRLFKACTGLTPKAYAMAQQARYVREALSHSATVTEAIHGAGFGSDGRFYAQSTGLLGMTPTRFRAGGVNETLRFAVGSCSLGRVLVASSEQGVAAILIGDEPQALLHDLQDRFPRARLVDGDADYAQRVAQVIGFVEAPGLGLDLPLDVRGTAFQQRVWQALRQIPSGRTTTYREVADMIGAPTATRAVAGACAANPIAVAVPCHRVVRSDGSLSGYRWGVERKRALLEREAAAAGDATGAETVKRRANPVA